MKSNEKQRFCRPRRLVREVFFFLVRLFFIIIIIRFTSSKTVALYEITCQV